MKPKIKLFLYRIGLYSKDEVTNLLELKDLKSILKGYEIIDEHQKGDNYIPNLPYLVECKFYIRLYVMPSIYLNFMVFNPYWNSLVDFKTYLNWIESLFSFEKAKEGDNFKETKQLFIHYRENNKERNFPFMKTDYFSFLYEIKDLKNFYE